MRIPILTTLIVLSIAGKSQELSKHELGLNFAKAPDYKSAVWDESMSFMQVISPITYKYFINDSSALRAGLHYNSNYEIFSCCNAHSELDATRFSLGVGYQRFFAWRKLRPSVYSDFSFVSEDYYDKHRSLGPFSTTDYTSLGFSLSGGLGLRYELSQRWALAYEGDIGLYTRRKNGYEEVGTTSRTQWSNAMVTNWRVNPVSNISINFRF